MTEKVEKSQNTIFIGSQVTLLLGFTLLFSVVFAGAFYWFYRYTESIALNRLKQELLNTVSAAAFGIDVDEFVGLAKDGVVRADGYTDDPRYWKHVDWLLKISKTNPKAQVYSYIAGTKPKEVVFIGSVGAVAESPGGDPPPWGAKFQEHYTSSGVGKANLLTGLDHLDGQDVPYSDPWGRWLSGYGPIVNAKGEVVGAIGVDLPFDYVEEVRQRVLDNVAIAFSITYGILFALVYLISRFMTRPIVNLTHIAEQIAEGNYDQNLNLNILRIGRFRNEITSLADVFEFMIEKVREREQTLINQVQELKIQIDERKAQQQIGEIVDSEFFQSLRAKAKKIRDDRGKGKQGS